MTTNEQAQWVLALVLAGWECHAGPFVVSQIVRAGGTVWETATDALRNAGFYDADGTRTNMLTIRRAIRLLDEAPE